MTNSVFFKKNKKNISKFCLLKNCQRAKCNSLIAPGKAIFECKSTNIFLCARHFEWGHIVSPLSVRTSVPFVRSVRNTNGFRAISFERIGVLD